MAKKMDSRSFAQSKRTRRQWLTFIRMCRYGINNFSRNAWLSLAATAVMTITLLVIFVSFTARNVLIDTVGQIRDNVDMSIYLKSDTSTEDALKVKSDLEKLSTVRKVSYISPEDARRTFASQNKADAQTLEALNEASNTTNQFPSTLRVNIADINNTSELTHFVDTNQTLKAHIDPDNKPSFAGERRTAIQNIGQWVGFAERVGIGATVLFVAISSLIVFNTIRMAIFNRKEEIQMMKLIGADKAFIRGPFIVEAIFYGVIAAIIATSIGLTLLYTSKAKLLYYQIAVQPTINMMTVYVGVVIIAMIFIGALIGVISSLFATRRYLKI
jgi:cell division transport system permease protein